METNKVSMEFRSYADPELGTFGGKVASGLTKNSVYPNPPVPGPELGKLADNLLAGVRASIQGSVKDTAAKNNARKALLEALRLDAHYVQSVKCPDLQTLLTTGFMTLTPAFRPATPLTPPAVELLNDAGSTRLHVQISRVQNARSYQVQYCDHGQGDAWKELGMFNTTRGVLLENLTPGTVYNVRVRAIGGSTGASDWSEPASKMAT